MTRTLRAHGCCWSLLRHLCPALLVLALAPLGPQARAASPSPESSAQAPSASALFVRACEALEAGELEQAESNIRALREALPQHPEPRLLESLLALRRTRPDLGWRDAFLQAWHGLGRPDFSDSPLLQDVPSPRPAGLSPEALWKRELSAEQRFLLALSLGAEAEERARAVLQYLPLLAPPELLVAAREHLERAELPAPLRAETRAALRARLAALSADYPQSMQLRALLLLDGTGKTAPFTPSDVRELEALSQLTDWRPSDFLSLYRAALRSLEATGLALADHHAYTLAVVSLVSPVPELLKHRTDASWKVLPPAEYQRLGEALWRIGARLSEESSVVELLVGLSLMQTAAIELEDLERLEQVSQRLEQERASYRAWDNAATVRWPLPSLRREMIESSMKDEVAHMRAFSAPEGGAR